MTPTEIELTNRWLKLYEAKEALYEEKVRLENKCIRLKADNQSLKATLEQKSSFLMQVLQDMSDRDKKENDIYRQLGALKEKNRWADARLAKCRRLFADDDNKDNPDWPPLDMKEIPPFKMTPDREQPDKDDDILSLFKQSSKGI